MTTFCPWEASYGHLSTRERYSCAAYNIVIGQPNSDHYCLSRPEPKDWSQLIPPWLFSQFHFQAKDQIIYFRSHESHLTHDETFPQPSYFPVAPHPNFWSYWFSLASQEEEEAQEGGNQDRSQDHCSWPSWRAYFQEYGLDEGRFPCRVQPSA